MLSRGDTITVTVACGEENVPSTATAVRVHVCVCVWHVCVCVRAPSLHSLRQA
jgi:hypothetical protein